MFVQFTRNSACAKSFVGQYISYVIFPLICLILVFRTLWRGMFADKNAFKSKSKNSYFFYIKLRNVCSLSSYFFVIFCEYAKKYSNLFCLTFLLQNLQNSFLSRVGVKITTILKLKLRCYFVRCLYIRGSQSAARKACECGPRYRYKNIIFLF